MMNTECSLPDLTDYRPVSGQYSGPSSSREIKGRALLATLRNYQSRKTIKSVRLDALKFENGRLFLIVKTVLVIKSRSELVSIYKKKTEIWLN